MKQTPKVLKSNPISRGERRRSDRQVRKLLKKVGAGNFILHVTVIRDKFAKTLDAKDMSLAELRDLILKTTAKAKVKLPWLKLATFGNKRTDKGSLRHDENVQSISGVEADYDGEKVSFDDALEIIKKGNLSALIYTSPSHCLEKPRWRILFLISREMPPVERARLVARANGVFEGIFANESFTLSQSYYFGSVNRNPAHRAEIIDGDFIDLRPDLDAGAKYRQSENALTEYAKKTAYGFEAKLALLGDGPGLVGFHKPLCAAVASYVATHGRDVDREKLKARLWEAINGAPTTQSRRDYLDDAHLDAMIDSAIKKYGEGDDDIKRLNEIHAVLPIGGKTKVVTFGELDEFPGRKTIVMTQSFDDFKALKNKYRHNFDDGKSTPLGTHWLLSSHRRQYDGGMAFMPHTDDKSVGDKLNLWNGFGVHAVEGDCSLFLDFAREVICSGNNEHFDYLIKREAFILQKRKRSEIALALRSKEEGVGKGLYERIIGHLYGNHAMQIANPAHVIGKFNPHLETLLRLTADEALFVGDPRHRNALFGIVTEAKMTIEPKFAGVYSADSFLNLSLTTNADHFIPVSGTARRFFVPTVSACHMQDFAYFDAILKQMRNGGYEALLHHLLHIDLSKFNVREVPKTAGLAEQAAYSRRGVEGLVEEACSMARVPCPHPRWPGFTMTNCEVDQSQDYTLAHLIAKTKDQELGRLSSLTVSKRLCKEWGCVSERRRESDNCSQRTSGLQWPPLAELRRLFIKKFGPQEWQLGDETKWTVVEEEPRKQLRIRPA